jgi:hypothetical protein
MQKLNEAFVQVALETLSKDEAIRFIAETIAHRDAQIKLLMEMLAEKA